MAKKKKSSNSNKTRSKKTFSDETVTRISLMLVYPESAPADWKEKLLAETSVVSVIVSPLHNEDTYTEKDLKETQELDTTMSDGSVQKLQWGIDKNGNQHYIGEPKKPHYHAIVRRNSTYTVKNWKALSQRTVNCQLVEPCISFKAMVRYLVHYDDDEKHKYRIADIECYGTNKNILLYFEDELMTSADIYCILKNIVIEKNFTEFYELDDYIYSQSNDKYLQEAFQTNQSVRNHIDRYINSKRNSINYSIEEYEAYAYRGRKIKEMSREISIKNNFKVVHDADNEKVN